jgi:hypothetical protein
MQIVLRPFHAAVEATGDREASLRIMNPIQSAAETFDGKSAPGRPFDLVDPAAYAAWRTRKLDEAPRTAAELMIPIANAEAPTAAESAAIRALCRRCNMALYGTPGELSKDQVLALSASVGLADLERPLLTGEDGITELSVTGMARGGDDGNGGDGRRGIYIPYSNKPLSWHTDGYYNPAGQWVLGMVLHCVRPSATGGASQFLDPEIAYIRLRDENPAWIAALMHPQTLIIPANDIETDTPRGAEAGPVFAVINGRLAIAPAHRLRKPTRDRRRSPALPRTVPRTRRRLTKTHEARRSIMSQPILLSDIIIHNPQARSFNDLIDAIKVTADDSGRALLEIDIKPDFPDTPRNWEFLVETAFTWGTR